MIWSLLACDMARIVGIAGSLRQSSYNAALLKTAAELVPEGSEIVIESLRGIPVYDGDLEDQGGLPERVSELQSALAGADGVLLVTPEYNAGVPGAAKTRSTGSRAVRTARC